MFSTQRIELPGSSNDYMAGAAAAAKLNGQMHDNTTTTTTSSSSIGQGGWPGSADSAVAANTMRLAAEAAPTGSTTTTAAVAAAAVGSGEEAPHRRRRRLLRPATASDAATSSNDEAAAPQSSTAQLHGNKAPRGDVPSTTSDLAGLAAAQASALKGLLATRLLPAASAGARGVGGAGSVAAPCAGSAAVLLPSKARQRIKGRGRSGSGGCSSSSGSDGGIVDIVKSVTAAAYHGSDTDLSDTHSASHSSSSTVCSGSDEHDDDMVEALHDSPTWPTLARTGAEQQQRQQRRQQQAPKPLTVQLLELLLRSVLE